MSKEFKCLSDLLYFKIIDFKVESFSNIKTKNIYCIDNCLNLILHGRAEKKGIELDI